MKVDPGMRDSQVLVFDIETRQTTDSDVIERLTGAATDARPAQKTAKALKETWDQPEQIAARVRAALRKTPLDPLYAEVVCICWAEVAYDSLLTRGFVGSDERELLEYIAGSWTWRPAATGVQRNPIWCGHRIRAFDLPILLNRFRHHRITPPDLFPQWAGRYWRGRIHDTMDHFPSRPFISAVEACDFYGVSRSPVMWQGEEISGARVQQLVDAGEWDLIDEYCTGDVLDTFGIYCVQTANEQRPSYGIESGGLESTLRDIDDAESLTDAAKWLTARAALKSAGALE